MTEWQTAPYAQLERTPTQRGLRHGRPAKSAVPGPTLRLLDPASARCAVLGTLPRSISVFE
jgi:hypothetical protein